MPGGALASPPLVQLAFATAWVALAGRLLGVLPGRGKGKQAAAAEEVVNENDVGPDDEAPGDDAAEDGGDADDDEEEELPLDDEPEAEAEVDDGGNEHLAYDDDRMTFDKPPMEQPPPQQPEQPQPQQPNPAPPAAAAQPHAQPQPQHEHAPLPQPQPPAPATLAALTAAVTSVAGASGPGYHNHWHPDRLGHAIALGHFLLNASADLSAFGVARGSVPDGAEWQRRAKRLYRQFTQQSPAYLAVVQRIQQAQPPGVPQQLRKYDVLAGVLIASNWAF